MLARYAYDADGVRIRKVTGGTTTDYLTDGTTILQETKSGTINATLKYVYGQSGLEYILHNGNTYWPLKNQQGDIIGLAKINGDGSASLICRYEYSAFGELLSVTDANGNPITAANHIANLNPFRYRGYYYDTETGYYYLQSRYYDPEIGRFLNADGYVSTGQSILGFNMFAYCGNNPVNTKDSSGTTPQEVQQAGISVAKHVAKTICCLLFIGLLSFGNGNEYYTTNDMRICTDGAPKNIIPDDHWQHTTAYGRHYPEPPIYLNALEVNYIVLPGDYSGEIELGDIGIVRDNTTANFSICIVGEIGPDGATFGEVSIATAWDLGYVDHQTANIGISGDFSIYMFPNKKASLNWNKPIQPQIEDLFW